MEVVSGLALVMCGAVRDQSAAPACGRINADDGAPQTAAGAVPTLSARGQLWGDLSHLASERERVRPALTSGRTHALVALVCG